MYPRHQTSVKTSSNVHRSLHTFPTDRRRLFPVRTFHPTEAVILREMWGDRVFAARPALVIADTPALLQFYKPPGVRMQVAVGADGRERRLPGGEWTTVGASASARHVLSFAFPDTPYAVLMFWDREFRFGGWYVNLQSPLERTPLGFDTREHLLDVVIAADRRAWRWKDEDELEEAVALGLFTGQDAVWFRYWGERAVEHVLLREPPFDGTWETWRPDPAWPVPSLGADWAKVFSPA
ncbi:MAG: hypothetical protein QOI81_291 [Actinomycetota bacterium]|nr:hypothetical protein [Actinomycetota bacterium]